MTRIAIAFLSAGLLASAALGQGFNSPPPAVPGPFAPRFGPVMPWGYGPGLALNWSLPGVSGGLRIGGGLGLPYYSYFPPAIVIPSTAPAAPTASPITAPPLQGAGGTGPTVGVEIAAELTIVFPVSANVTVNGNPVPGADQTVVLASPPLKAGERHTFKVVADWVIDGKKFEWDREVTLAAGERGRVSVTRGFPVKD